MDENDDPIVNSEPWPADSILAYTSIGSGNWGYLNVHASNKFSFTPDKRPSDEEILARWGKEMERQALKKKRGAESE